MSEPPPGAVLMTNSTGRDGFSAAVDDAAALAAGVGALGAAGGPPHAAPTTTAAVIAAKSLLALACNMPAPPRTRTCTRDARLSAGLTRRHRNGTAARHK